MITLQNPTLTREQAETLETNYAKSGPRFLQKDLHPMLDCGREPSPEPGDRDGSDDREFRPLRATAPLFIQKPGVLRAEFFGGIFCTSTDWVEYYLDHCGFEALTSLHERPQSPADLIQKLAYSPSEISDAISTLSGLGLITDTPSDSKVRFLPMINSDISYLQRPTLVEIELTYGCFRACQHCAYNSAPDVDVSREIKADQWAIIFAKLASEGVFHVQLTGGDPFFRTDIAEILRAAESAGLGIYIRSDTAALSDHNVALLKDLRGLWAIGTSIDGSSDREHDWMRGRGAFDLLKKRVKILADNGIAVTAGATLHNRNVSTVREMGRLVTDLGAKWFDVGFLSPVGRGRSLADLVLTGDQIALALSDYIEGILAKEYRPFRGVYARFSSPAELLQESGFVLPQLPYLTEWPWNRMRLDPMGNTYTAGKAQGSYVSSGFNLLSRSVEDVWHNSPNLVELRRLGRGKRIHGLDFRTFKPLEVINV